MVQTKGQYLPVPGITIAWAVVGTPLKGTVVTDGNGHYEIHIRDTEQVLLAQVRNKTNLRQDADVVDVVLTASEFKNGMKQNSHFICDDGVRICGGYDEVTNEAFPAAVYNTKATYLKFEHGELLANGKNLL